MFAKALLIGASAATTLSQDDQMAMPIEDLPDEVCINNDYDEFWMPVENAHGDRCDEYMDNQHWCGQYDTDEFHSLAMCCACGGGIRFVEDDVGGQDEGWESIDEEDYSEGHITWENSDDGSSSGSDEAPFIDADQLDMYWLYIEEAYDAITDSTLPVHDWVSIEEVKEFVEENSYNGGEGIEQAGGQHNYHGDEDWHDHGHDDYHGDQWNLEGDW